MTAGWFWIDAFQDKPWKSWFWAEGINYNLPRGQTEFYKIPPENGYRQQLAVRSPEDRKPTAYYQLYVRANVIYVFTLPGDLPNWGGIGSFVEVSPPCGNWYSEIYKMPGQVTRSQTSGINAAIRGERENAAGIAAALAKTDELGCGVKATIQGSPELDVGIRAAILGDATRYLPIRAAIRAERLLEPAIIAAIGKDFNLLPGVIATIQGNPQQHCHLKAAIKGETEKTCGIKAFVVKTRVDHILLEMENLWPQELDLRSTPNWASKVKDYRKSNLSARDS